MKSAGEKIRLRRISLGLSQNELANQTGITIRTISKYETGGSEPRGVNLQKVASVLKVSPSYIVDPDIDDVNYGLEEAPYIEAARQQYGSKGGRDMQALLQDNLALFAGGDIPQEDKDAFFNAVMGAYLATKKEASERFNPHKNGK